ncbi:MAG TPA: glycosyltransferase N-terminal domain-containing protein [Caulobacteraceae bacterium]
MSAGLALYRAGMGLLEPFAPAVLRRRARRGKEDPARVHERLGRPTTPRPAGPVVWLHGASVGESLSLLPLIDRLRRDRPELTLLATSGTVTSAELLARRLPEGVIHQYVPVDTPQAARRFLDWWRPDLAVFVESELWPNLLLGAKARGAKLALVSARLSKESTGGWARVPAAARRLLGAFDLLLPQDDDTAARLSALGARDDGRLNLKLAGDPLPADPETLAAVTSAAAGRPVLLAASTHPGEEEIVVDAFTLLPDKDARLVIVPRHPARGPEVARLGWDRGWHTERRNEGEPFGDARVYVADTLGELGVWFRLCTAAFVGGSLLPGVGGHNPLEPARLDRPAASGPHVENWRSVYAALEREGGIRWVRDAAELAAFWRDALEGRRSLCSQAEHARLFAKAQSGAVDDAVRRLLELIA